MCWSKPCLACAARIGKHETRGLNERVGNSEFLSNPSVHADLKSWGKQLSNERK